MTDGTENLDLCGYVFSPPEIERIKSQIPDPVLMCAALGIQDSGRGKDVFLWEIERALTGDVRRPHNQTIGDCVSQGVTGAAEDLQWILIAQNPTLEFHMLASEVTYALARHQIGKDGCGFSDGAVVAWGLLAGRDYGFVSRGKHLTYDLTNYSGALAKKWGAPRVGCPDDLAEYAKHYPIREMKQIEGPDFYSQAIDVIANSGLIVTGSNQLFRSTRDKFGFCLPGGRGGHCTYFDGFTDNPKRPGIVYTQSWGDDTPVGGSVKVTLPHGRDCDLPAGKFLVDADEFNKMHARGGEMWAITSMVGFAKPDIDIEFSFYN